MVAWQETSQAIAAHGMVMPVAWAQLWHQVVQHMRGTATCEVPNQNKVLYKSRTYLKAHIHMAERILMPYGW